MPHQNDVENAVDLVMSGACVVDAHHLMHTVNTFRVGNGKNTRRQPAWCNRSLTPVPSYQGVKDLVTRMETSVENKVHLGQELAAI